jgi:pimeloyl-ACP methyl ester carboxylesterase
MMNYMQAPDLPTLTDEIVQLPDGPALAVRSAAGHKRPFLLVHGLASNARLWDGVARRLAAAGHAVVAVDQRGHGNSEVTADGYDTKTAAADLAALCCEMAWTNERAPIVAGQSWGGNVVLTLAAQYGGVAGLALVDGGWIYLADRFETFDDCWTVLAPPNFDHLTRAGLVERASAWNKDWSDEARAATLANFGDGPDGFVYPHLSREHHKSIVHSLYVDDPRPLYAHISVPVTLMAAVSDVPTEQTAVTQAADALPDSRISWYVGGHHDLHAEQPDRCAAELLELATRVEARTATTDSSPADPREMTT